MHHPLPDGDNATWEYHHDSAGVATRFVAAAGIGTQWMIDPRPNSYIGEFRDDYPDLDYIPRTRQLTIEGMAEAA